MKRTIFFMIAILMSMEMVYSTITVRRPGNGDNWLLGKIRTIRWSATRDDAKFKLVLFKDGRRLGNIAVNVSSRRKSYRWTVGQYEGGNATVGSGYQIKVKRKGKPDSGMSNGTFNITIGIIGYPGGGIRILSPARGDRLRSFSRTTIRWTMPIDCGDKVELSVVKVGSGFTYYPIAETVNCSPGENSYSWIVRSPDFTGTPVDFRIRILSDSCRNESAPFQIVSSMENTDDNRCDYLIDSVTFSNGLSLEHGLNYTPDSAISNTFQVNVKWNKVESAHKGTNRVYVKSVLTGETVSLTTNTNRFSFEDAHPSTGIIQVPVPLYIARGKVESMIRGRFIPLSFRLFFNPSSCDNFAPNNNKEFKLRILEAPRVVNFKVEIDKSSLFLDTKPSIVINNDRLEFRVKVKVKNLIMPSSPVQNVKFRYVIKYWAVPIGYWANLVRKDNLVLKSVRCDEWSTIRVNEEITIRQNFWKDLYFVINVDPDKQFYDPYRSNNEAQIIFKKPPK